MEVGEGWSGGRGGVDREVGVRGGGAVPHMHIQLLRN